METIQHAELLWGGHVNLGSKSVAVRKIQEWLCFHGFPVGIDNVFGKKTQQALADFFRLPVAKCEVVDSYRFAQLSAPLKRATQLPVQQPPQTLAEAALMIARQHLVNKPCEIGGANSGPWVRHYMRGREGVRAPWCAGFVSTAWAQAARWMQLPLPGYTASCDHLALRAHDDGRFLKEGEKPAEVCAIFVRRRDQSDWDHTGFAYDFGPTSFETIEGNTNDGGSREGVKMCQRRRTYSHIDFVRVIAGT